MSDKKPKEKIIIDSKTRVSDDGLQKTRRKSHRIFGSKITLTLLLVILIFTAILMAVYFYFDKTDSPNEVIQGPENSQETEFTNIEPFPSYSPDPNAVTPGEWQQ